MGAERSFLAGDVNVELVLSKKADVVSWKKFARIWKNSEAV